METHFHGDGTKTIHLSVLEKSVVGLFGSLTLAALIWVGTSVSDMSVRMAVVESQLMNMEDSMGDRYTGSQARAHEREMDRRVSRLEAAHGLE